MSKKSVRATRTKRKNMLALYARSPKLKAGYAKRRRVARNREKQ